MVNSSVLTTVGVERHAALHHFPCLRNGLFPRLSVIRLGAGTPLKSRLRGGLNQLARVAEPVEEYGEEEDGPEARGLASHARRLLMSDTTQHNTHLNLLRQPNNLLTITRSKLVRERF